VVATSGDAVAKKKLVGIPDANTEHVGEDAPVPPEPGKKKRSTEPAQLLPDIVEMGQLVAQHYDTTIGKLFDPVLRKWLTPLYAKVLREKAAKLPPELRE
jgi:hypothetical protein